MSKKPEKIFTKQSLTAAWSSSAAWSPLSSSSSATRSATLSWRCSDDQVPVFPEERQAFQGAPPGGHPRGGERRPSVQREVQGTPRHGGAEGGPSPGENPGNHQFGRGRGKNDHLRQSRQEPRFHRPQEGPRGGRGYPKGRPDPRHGRPSHSGADRIPARRGHSPADPPFDPGSEPVPHPFRLHGKFSP